MLILTIRTDKPEAEIGLYNERVQQDYVIWEAHRALAETIHAKIQDLLTKHHQDWQAIEGIVVYKGPGSFTGLRIGISLANSLKASLRIPLVAESGRWLEAGIERLLAGEYDQVALPDYGALPHTTAPRK